MHEENPASYTHINGKGKSNIIDFSVSYGYSYLIIHQNLTIDGYLKVSGNMESDAYQ